VHGRGIPTVPLTASGGQIRLDEINSIIVDTRYANSVNLNGETLIPPSLHEFAETFAQDLKSIHVDVGCDAGASASNGSIFLTLGDSSDFLDAAGRESAEGYRLSVSDSGIEIAGASSLGVWWGTRTLLQQVSRYLRTQKCGSTH
jgi:hexosaminidase